jgi:hypothetical protein
MNEFHITLLSNSSMDFFPNNKTANFTVHLPKSILLEGKWQMALTECHYQYNFWNVTKNNNSVHFAIDYVHYQCQIPEGYYEKIEQIIEKLNEGTTPFLQNGFLQINSSNNYVNFTESALLKIQGIKFENRLALQLGYDPEDTIKPHLLKPVQPSDVSRGIPDEMFVYCNLAEPQLFGHEFAPIVRIINIPKKDTHYGQSHHKEFQRLHYVGVSKKSFTNVSIELRDKTGNFLPFVNGTFMCVLHFKKLA